MEALAIPLYQKLKNELIKKISNEEYTPNSLIPSERELSELYNVSRITVRKAIDQLVSEQCLYRVPSKGTYVKEKNKVENLVALKSSTHMLRDMGLDPVVKTIKSQIQIVPKNIRKKLKLEENEKVYYTERIIYVDDIPVSYTKSYLVYNYVLGIEKYNLNNRSLYTLLEDYYKFEILGAHHSVVAGMVKGDMADALQIDSQTPVVKFDGQVYANVNNSTVLFEYVKTYYRCDRYKCYINGI